MSIESSQRKIFNPAVALTFLTAITGSAAAQDGVYKPGASGLTDRAYQEAKAEHQKAQAKSAKSAERLREAQEEIHRANAEINESQKGKISIEIARRTKDLTGSKLKEAYIGLAQKFARTENTIDDQVLRECVEMETNEAGTLVSELTPKDGEDILKILPEAIAPVKVAKDEKPKEATSAKTSSKPDGDRVSQGPAKTDKDAGRELAMAGRSDTAGKVTGPQVDNRNQRTPRR